MPGAPQGPMSSTPPAGTTVTTPGRTGRPSSVAEPTAPARHTRVRRSKRSRGPVSTASSPAAVGGLPTARLARAKERSSQAPDGGTPTSHRPVRPARSCTPVCTPGESTSTVPVTTTGRTVVTPTTPAAGSGWGPSRCTGCSAAAVADQHQHVPLGAHLDVLAGGGHAVGEGQPAVLGERHVHEEVDVVPELAGP